MTNKSLLTTCLSILISQPVLADVGFEHGNEFQPYSLTGYATVECREGPQYINHTYYCYDTMFDPVEMDRWVGPSGVDADQVTLSVNWNQKERKQTEKYDSKKGKSERFNLFVATLFQRPLIHAGVNQVHYTLDKDKKTVQEGDFEVTVKNVQYQKCRDRSYFEWSLQNCQNNDFAVCRKYFRDENYCK